VFTLKIGIYGGTFDPIHQGHMVAAKQAAEGLGLDKLLLIPAGIPPHKDLPQETAPAEHRMEMTRLAAERLGLPKSVSVEVLDMEVRREGKSYTRDTVRALHEAYPQDELWLLMGTDMFLTLHTWNHPEEICALAGICAFGRAKGDEAQFAPEKQFLEENYGAKVVLLTLEGVVEVSSTQLRTQLSEGGEPEGLDPSIYGYILRKGLYGVKVDLKHLTDQQLRSASYSMVKAKRIPHIRGTEETAALLAKRWGVDEELARRAAILHDCTKYLNLEEQLKLCEDYGILLDNLEQHALKLLHSKTGAAIARNTYGACDEIYWAIYWHTTGKADMTRLEKVIYIADYMEPTRDFPGVEKLRELVYQDLDAAVLLGLEMSVEEMEEMGNPVHFRTLEARDWLRQRLR
jgi:nicotinate-nucleotide adenylyltransferase